MTKRRKILASFFAVVTCLMMCVVLNNVAFASIAVTNNAIDDELSRAFLNNDATVTSELVSAKNGVLVYRFVRNVPEKGRGVVDLEKVEYVQVTPLTDEAAEELTAIAATGGGSSYKHTYDNSMTVHISSTVNYVTYDNAQGLECAYMVSASGGILEVNSGFSVVSSGVYMGQIGVSASSGLPVQTQNVSYNTGTNWTWSFNAPATWQHIRITGADGYAVSPLLGCTYTVTIQRLLGGSSITAELVNNVYE